MAVRSDPPDPQSLTPEQRLDELCAQLAAGVQRALALGADVGGRDSAESTPNQLDESPETSVHGPRG
jgi:hypothetical protein